MAGKAEGLVTPTGIEQDGADVDLSASTTPDTEDLIIKQRGRHLRGPIGR